MPWCDSCKHFSIGFCKKYNKLLYRSNKFSIHPFDYVELYYQEKEKDITHLMEIADKYLISDIAKSICKQYKEKGNITFKQRIVLISQILKCYEPRDSIYDKLSSDWYFWQIED